MTAYLPAHGADLSHHNPNPALVRAKRAGLQFLYHKATEGSTMRDPQYHARRSAAAKAGLPFGAYHFASPDGNDAVEEARAFMAYAKPRLGDLVPALDMEVAGSARLEDWSKKFMAEVMRLLKLQDLKPAVSLMHYGPDDYGKDYPYLRWVPRYNNANEKPRVRFDIWQFTDGIHGKPNSFPGLGNVDLNTLRPGLTVDSFRLVAIPEKPKPKPKPKGDVIKVDHISLLFSLSPKKHTADITKIFERCKAQDVKWITGTEAGPGSNNTAAELVRIGKLNGYRVFVTDKTDAWIAVAENIINREWKTGYIPVIPGSKAAGDPHGYGPKGILWVQWFSEKYGRIAVSAAHHLTKGRFPGQAQKDKPKDPVDHYAENKKLSLAIGAWADKFGAGGNLAFFGGDTNMVDEKVDVFFGAPLTTLWDELDNHQGTGHGNIDVIASYDKDGRVVGRSCEALDDKEFPLETDHFLVEGSFFIKPVR